MNHKIIEILDTFKYSCNIKSDYLDETRINAFLPNYQLVEYLKSIISDLVANNSTKSILLSGAYGTGKSYLISIICAILSKNTLNLQSLVKKIQNYTSSDNLISKNIKTGNYLIVFAQDTFKHFKQAITQGIVNASKENNLDVEFNYIFDIIIDKIKQWEINFPYFYNLLQKNCHDIQKLLFKLNNHDPDALNQFIELYPRIMAGESFSLISENVSLVDNLEQFEYNAISLGYSGVIYVFDEFGRYLETNLHSIDVKEVQDMSEFCNRTNSKSSLILSTHKGLFQYSGIDSDKDNQIEWEKVSGRFQQIHLSNDTHSITNIINTVVSKTQYYKEFIKQNEDQYNEYIDNFYELGTTEDVLVLDKIFPLNYVTTKLLPILTSKLGQNDRTLYTFLCSDQKGALKDLFAMFKRNFRTITPDSLFDYFSTNLDNLDLRSYEYKVYNIAKNHLRSTKITNEKKIIKILALFSIIDSTNDLQANKAILKLATGLGNENFNKVLKTLISKRIIIYRRHTELYELATDLTYNIDEDVDEFLNQNKISNKDIGKKLLEVVSSEYVYPYIYNQKYHINRYLHSFYIFDYDLASFLNSDKLDKNSDYNIIFLITTNKHNSVDLTKIKNTLLLSNNKSTLDIEFFLKELCAIQVVSTYPNYKDNRNALIELDRFKFESINKVKNAIHNYFSFSNSIYIYPEKIKLKNETELQIYLKNHLEKKYPNFIPINYEVINMSKLSVPIKTARKRILEILFENKFDHGYFESTGAPNSIARIVLLNTGILDNEHKIALDKSIFKNFYKELLKDISTGSKKFSFIYNKYTSINGKYGFRKGIFSLLVATFLKYYEKNIYITQISNNIIEEIDLTPEVVNEIEDNPANYELHYYAFDSNVDAFFQGIRSFLINYIDDRLFQIDPSKACIKALVQFLYDRSDLMFSSEGFRYQSKHDINQFIQKVSERTPKQFWFKIMPEYFSEVNLISIRENITDRLQELLNGEKSLIEHIKSLVFDLLADKIGNTIISEDNIVEILINYNYKNDFINDILKEKLTNDNTWLQNFTEYVSGFSFKRWTNEKQIDEFRYKIQKLFNCEDNNKSLPSKSRNTGLCKVLKSKINSQLVNFGTALSKEEKIEILEQLIKEVK